MERFRRVLYSLIVVSLPFQVPAEYFWQQEAKVVDGWYGTYWFGWVYPTEIQGWGIHSGIGYFYSTSDTVDAAWIYTPSLHWLFASRSAPSYFYHNTGDDWLFHLSSSPDWWFSNNDQEWWEIDNRMGRIEFAQSILDAYGYALDNKIPGGLLNAYEKKHEKWFFYIEGGDGIPCKLLIDTADYFGITPEGRTGKVSVWFEGGFDVSLEIPVAIGFARYNFNDAAPDPFRVGSGGFPTIGSWQYSLGEVNGISEHGGEGGIRYEEAELLKTDSSQSVLKGSVGLIKGEYLKSEIDHFLERVFPVSGPDAMDVVLSPVSQVEELLSELNLFLETPWEPLSSEDDGTSKLAGSITRIRGPYHEMTGDNHRILVDENGSAFPGVNGDEIVVTIRNDSVDTTDFILEIKTDSTWKVGFKPEPPSVQAGTAVEVRLDVHETKDLTVLVESGQAEAAAEIHLALCVDTSALGENPTVADAQIQVLSVDLSKYLAIATPAVFSLIPPGTFTMGSPADEAGSTNYFEKQHAVTLTRAFYLQTTEVTHGQWKTVRDEGLGRDYTDLPEGHAGYAGGNNWELPVTMVTWYDVVKWLNLKSELAELTPCYTVDGSIYKSGIQIPECNFDASGYRLPTESEWEYACRAGTTTAFYSGPITYTDDTLDPNLDAIGWYSGNYKSTLSSRPVGDPTKQPNDWELYDMSGNVQEWCWDWYDVYPGTVTNPEGPESGAYRVLRGGAWNDYARFCRSAARVGHKPGIGNGDIGFRMARTASP